MYIEFPIFTISWIIHLRVLDTVTHDNTIIEKYDLQGLSFATNIDKSGVRTPVNRYVKPKTIKLVFAASSLSAQH